MKTTIIKAEEIPAPIVFGTPRLPDTIAVTEHAEKLQPGQAVMIEYGDETKKGYSVSQSLRSYLPPEFDVKTRKTPSGLNVYVVRNL